MLGTLKTDSGTEELRTKVLQVELQRTTVWPVWVHLIYPSSLPWEVMVLAGPPGKYRQTKLIRLLGNRGIKPPLGAYGRHISFLQELLGSESLAPLVTIPALIHMGQIGLGMVTPPLALKTLRTPFALYPVLLEIQTLLILIRMLRIRQVPPVTVLSS